MIPPMLALVINIHKFVRHKWNKKVPKTWKNLGTWKYVTTFKYPYQTIPEILTKQYDLQMEDNIIAYITKEITTPKFNRYRTKFKKVFHGQIKDYKKYLKEFIRKRKTP